MFVDILDFVVSIYTVTLRRLHRIFRGLEKYMTPHSYYDIAIEGQPKEQIYYHRSIQDIFNLCFRAGFVIDGFYEECFKTNKEIPMVMIVRLKKVKRDSLK